MESVSPMTLRVERLVRSLVGVADLHLTWSTTEDLGDVHILRGDRVQHHQLIRNVVSGLQAGFGIRLEVTQVRVHETRDAFDAAVPRASARPGSSGTGGKPAATGAAAKAPGHGRVGEESGRPPRHHASEVASAEPMQPAQAEPHRAMRARLPELVVEDGSGPVGTDGVELERMDVERNGPLLRCRVTLRSGAQRYSAIAEAPHSAAAEAELAGRVTLDALRAGSLTEAVLDGVGMLTIGDTSYIVAAVRDGSAAARASAAPLNESMAWSAGVAVLNAVAQVEPRALTPRPALSAG